MNDKDLKKSLQALPVPVPNESARERAWHRAQLAFTSARSLPNTEKFVPRSFVRWALPVGAALALLATGLWFSVRPAPENTFAWNRTLQEMEALFSNRLNAIIERDGAFDVALSDDQAGAPGQPVMVEFRRGQDTFRVLGFSGRSVCVDLGGTTACFEPLVTGEGAVILSGKDFLWSPEHPAGPDGFTVHARPLPSAS